MQWDKGMCEGERTREFGTNMDCGLAMLVCEEDRGWTLELELTIFVFLLLDWGLSFTPKLFIISFSKLFIINLKWSIQQDEKR